MSLGKGVLLWEPGLLTQSCGYGKSLSGSLGGVMIIEATPAFIPYFCDSYVLSIRNIAPY